MYKSPNRNDEAFISKLENLLMDRICQKKFILIREFKIDALPPKRAQQKAIFRLA